MVPNLTVFFSVLVPSKFVDKKVILLDELYDSGNTICAVKEKLISELGKKPEDVFTCTLFIKENGMDKNPLPDLYGLALPDVWVVGYGLDDAQEKRGWVNLYAVPKIASIPPTADDGMFESTEKHQDCLNRLRNQLAKFN